jgi:anti-anti-sigma regulatory factor
VIEPTMTCRIERRVIEEDLVILHLSGQITEQDTDTLRASVEQNSSVVALDLGDILIVDREAIKLLACASLTDSNLGIVRPISVNGSQEKADRNGIENRTRRGERCDDA